MISSFTTPYFVYVNVFIKLKKLFILITYFEKGQKCAIGEITVSPLAKKTFLCFESGAVVEGNNIIPSGVRVLLKNAFMVR